MADLKQSDIKCSCLCPRCQINPADDPSCRGIMGRDGRDGRDGLNGKDGIDGKDGYSLSGPSGKDGKDGKDGIDRPTAYRILALFAMILNKVNIPEARGIYDDLIIHIRNDFPEEKKD